MAESLRSKVEEHLTCSVCLEQLKDPKVLPCLHSYCCECILKLARTAKRGSINCPECRMMVKVDQANISSMPSNFFVNNLLATMALTSDKPAKKILCDNCDSEDAAESRCNECGTFLCHFCTESHRRSRSTKLHKRVSVGELKSSVGPQSVAEKIRCFKHKDEVIKLYCKTCQTTICRDCTIVDHRQHAYGFVEDVAVREKRNLQVNVDEVKQRKVRVVNGIADLKKFDKDLEAQKKSKISEINTHFDELVRAVESRRRELVGKATSLTNLKQKQIRGQVEQLEMALASCESSIEFTEQAFKNGNDVQILSMQNYILHSLQQLKKVKDQTEPCVTKCIEFHIPSAVRDTKLTLLNGYAVDDVVASPSNCTASFTSQKDPELLELRKQYSITVVCYDKNNKRIKFGGQVVKPYFAGVQVTDVTVTDDGDGSHIIKFFALQGGVLSFNVTINGKQAPKCLLKKNVKWTMSDACGSGIITSDRLGLTGAGQPGETCWRVGACYFESGVHTWKIRIINRFGDMFHGYGGGLYKPTGVVSCRGPMGVVSCRGPDRGIPIGGTPIGGIPIGGIPIGGIPISGIPIGGDGQVGVIDCKKTFADIVGSEEMCVHSITGGQDVSLTLDMDAKTLTVSSLPEDGGFMVNMGTYTFSARRVSPFFSCFSPNVTISVIE